MPDMTLKAHGAHHIAPDIHGQNFWAIDRQFQDLLSLYMEPALLKHMAPHFDRLGMLAGGRLDELAQVADKHPPVLNPRDRFGRDEDWIDYHPAYREMEKIAFDEFGMHAMSHRAGVLGLAAPAHPLVKYGITYLFVQAEFGLMCPVSVSDTSTPSTSASVSRTTSPRRRLSTRGRTSCSTFSQSTLERWGSTPR